MRLAKLTVSGFKSFADRTEIAFSAPLVGIVGPNGCGKSNVVDAIKWVLGEQSAKSLRGGAMLDVIFNGSSSRRPAGMASVTLHFENPRRDDGQRGIPLDADEVSVTRRLYRDGTSEYLINQQKTRLRDIRALFYDTGIGAHGYCIIEQGKVDKMLVSNPAERRLIFEEAAGISKFKAQKKEAARKLERTEQNLLRCRDKLESVQKRLRSVKIQATRARNYQQYSERLRELRLEYTLAEFHKLTTQLAQVNARIADAEAERRQAMARLTAAEDQRSGAEAERGRLIAEQRELEQNRLRLQSQREQAQQRRQFAESNLTDLDEQVREHTQQQQELVQRDEQLDRQTREHAEALDALRRQVAQSQQQIEHAQHEQRSRQHELNEAQARLEDEKAGIVNLLRRTTDLHNQINALSLQQQNLTDHRDRLAGRADELAGELERLLSERDAANARLREANELITTENARLDEQKTAAADLSAANRRLTERLGEAKQRRSALESRRATLDELEQSRTGVDDAVKAVLARCAAGDEQFTFVRGLLAEMIRADVEHAPLVEAALGDHQQTLVIDRLAALEGRQAAIDSLSGRVTFVPADAPAGVRFDGPRDADELLRVIDLIEFDASVGPLVWRLLGRTLVVDDLDAARRMRDALPGGYRFVTRGGELLEADGRVVAGPTGEASGGGLISRRSELTALQQQLDALDAEIAADETHLAQLCDRAAHVERVQQELRQAIYEASTIKVELTSKLEQVNDAIARIEREQPVLARETEQIHDRLVAAQQEQQQRHRDVEALEQQQNESNRRVEALETQSRELKQAVEAATETVTAARVEAGKLAEQLAAAERQHRQLELAQSEAKRQLQQIADRLDEHRRRIAELQATRDEAAAQIEAADRALTEMAQKLETFEARLESIAAHVSQLAVTVRELRSRAEQIDSDLHQHQMTRREVEVRSDAVRQRAAEQLSLDLDAAYADYQERQIDWDAIETEIAELKGKLDRLGSVNLDAIEEQSDLEQREVDLRTEIDDIDHARAELERLIDQLDTESRTRFAETFNEIREHFAGRDGLFRKLFGGGRADIVLVPDDNGETDWLESGIEIIAKPPGKEPQSIRLLSGGERTMVAVALLMSIFRSRPSPFCVLDEVDAALDEANVDRFTTVIRSFLDHSHFIIITHHKRTMESADLLYGITMPIRGVSKRVAVRFDQVGAGGRLSADVVEQARREAQAEPETQDEVHDVEPLPEIHIPAAAEHVDA